MSVLITGSNGFLGSALANALDPAEAIVGVGLRPTSTSPRLCYRQIDITDRSAVAALFRDYRFSSVYHFAAVTEHSRIVDRKNQTLAETLRGTLNLVEEFEAVGGERFVYASSGKVYGPMTGSGLSEDCPTNPSNVLGKMKLLAEDVIRFFAEGSRRRYILARLFNIFGPAQKPTFVVPAMLTQLRTSRAIRLGELGHKRDYLYVDDVVEAMLALSRADLPQGLSIFNIGSGVARSVAELLAELEALLGFGIDVETDPAKLRGDEFSVEFADTGRLRALGWQPRHRFQEGLRKTAAYYAPELLA
jgi:nucleoside-diphosphate-sugar epimerase